MPCIAYCSFFLHLLHALFIPRKFTLLLPTPSKFSCRRSSIARRKTIFLAQKLAICTPRLAACMSLFSRRAHILVCALPNHTIATKIRARRCTPYGLLKVSKRMYRAHLSGRGRKIDFGSQRKFQLDMKFWGKRYQKIHDLKKSTGGPNSQYYLH